MASGNLKLFPYAPAPPKEIATLVDTDDTVVSSLTAPPSSIRPPPASRATDTKLVVAANTNAKAAPTNVQLKHSAAPADDTPTTPSEPTFKQQVDSGIVPVELMPSTSILPHAVAIFATSTANNSQLSSTFLPKTSARTILLFLAILAIAAAGGAIGAVCALGECSSTRRRGIAEDNVPNNTTMSDDDDADVQQKKVVAFINSITFNAAPLTYPSNATAEEAALTWLIDQDPLLRGQQENSPLRLRQRYALATLYFSGDWQNDNGWLSDSNECDWVGVTCQVGVSVTEVKLTNGATGGGSIPADLALLSSLRMLHLFENQLTGTIPTELGSLEFLENLEINTNQLTGTIPTELGQLDNLFSLSLYLNNLQSVIPTELGNMSNLISLALSNNDYSGTTPTQLGQLTNLQFLFLHHNDQLGGSLDFMCAGNLTSLVADCDIVTCSCCTFCCVEGGFAGIPEFGEQEGWCKG
jgi:hypothetical protein